VAGVIVESRPRPSASQPSPAGSATSQNVRWTISVSRDTDKRVRALLKKQGAHRGGLSAFIADAVRWRLFELNVVAAQAHNAAVPSRKLEFDVDQALTEVRKQRYAAAKVAL